MIVSRREKVRVGLFLVAALVVALGITLALAGLTTKPTNAYFTTFEESISGLDESSPVKYQGKKVGKVTTIGIDPESLLPRVDFVVDPSTPVREDTMAMLVVQGYATGLKYIELVKGSQKSAVRAPGTLVPSQPGAFTQIDRIMGRAEEALTSARTLMGHLDTTVVTATAFVAPTLEGVERSVQSLERTLDEGRGLISENRPAVKEAVASLAHAIDALRTVAEDAKKEELVMSARGALGKVESAAATIDRAAGNVGDLAARLERILARNNEAIDEIVGNLRRATRDLAVAAQEVKERPALLIRDVPRGVREVSR